MADPFTSALCGFFTRLMHEISPKDLGNAPSSMTGYTLLLYFTCDEEATHSDTSCRKQRDPLHVEVESGCIGFGKHTHRNTS